MMLNEIRLFDYHVLSREEEIVLYYKGPVNDILLAEISEELRKKFIDDPTANRKLFSVFIELAQNLLFYSAEFTQFRSNDRLGTILLCKSPDSYKLTTGNMVDMQQLQMLTDRCAYINTLDRDELREYKRKQRGNTPDETSKGAGIGLIQVALLSNRPLEVRHEKVSENHAFFAITVVIERQQV